MDLGPKRANDPPFQFVSPAITHYTFEEGGFAPRLSKLMLQMVSHGYLASERLNRTGHRLPQTGHGVQFR